MSTQGIGQAFLMALSAIGSQACSAITSAAATSAYPIIATGAGVVGAGVLGAVSSYICNRFTSRRDEHDKENAALAKALHNEHLAKAAADAVQHAILTASLPQDEKTRTALAEAAAKYWLQLQSEDDASIRAFAEKELPERLTEYLTDDTAQPRILLPAWKTLLQQAASNAALDSGLDELGWNTLAGHLCREYPRRLYNAFKSDLETGGAAFAGMVLRLLTQLTASVADLVKDRPGAPAIQTLATRFDTLANALLRDTVDFDAKLDDIRQDLTTASKDLRSCLARVEGKLNAQSATLNELRGEVQYGRREVQTGVTAIREDIAGLMARAFTEKRELKDQKDGHPLNPRNITIEYEDDWIIINGVEFSSNPLLSELTQIFGTPEVRKVRNFKPYNSNKEHALSSGFYWPELGIAANSIKHFFEADELSIPLEHTVWEGDPEPVDPQKTARISQIQILVDENDSRRFHGVLRICRLEFKDGITTEQLIHMKSGRPLVILNDESTHATSGLHDRETKMNISDGTLSKLQDGRCIELNSSEFNGCSMSVSGDDNADWHKRPIRVVNLSFEEYRHPCDELLHVLRAGEKIINSVHTGSVCVTRDTVSHTSTIDAMITNQRLVMLSTGWAAPQSIELSDEPDLTYEGMKTVPRLFKSILNRMLLPLSLIGIAWMLFSHANAAGREATFWRNIVRFGEFGIAIILGFLGVVVLQLLYQQLLPWSRPKSFCTTLRTKKLPAGIRLHHGSPVRRTIVGYNLMASFAHRLRCVVKRRSTCSN